MRTLDPEYTLFNFTEPFRTITILTYEISCPIADNAREIIAYLSVIGVLVNLFHIFILSRKSMRQSSVNVLMIGQSICDIIWFFDKTYQIPVVWHFMFNYDECDPPPGYFLRLFTFSHGDLATICRRISPWIGVVMAAFRLLISSFPFNNTIGKLGNPISSLFSILILFVLSSALTVPFYIQRTITSTRVWVPEESCGFPANYSQPIYGIGLKWDIDYEFSDLMFDWETVFVNLPPILLPFLSIGLIRVLRKHEKKRAELSSSSKEVTRHNTTKLVIMMTVCLMVAEVPFRITETIDISEYAAMLITDNLYLIFQIFHPLNSIAHCFINMMLSTEYRKCVKNVMPCVFRSENKNQSINSGSTRTSTISARNVTSSARSSTTRMT